MIELALLLLEVCASPPDLSPRTAPLCDDGTRAWGRDRTPNWGCERWGCGPLESLCWSDRLDHCYDVAGNELGVCEYAVETCNSRFSCFDLWLYCPGEYQCHDEDSWIGCTNGTCTTDIRPLPPTGVDFAAGLSAPMAEPPAGEHLWSRAQALWSVDSISAQCPRDFTPVPPMLDVQARVNPKGRS